MATSKTDSVVIVEVVMYTFDRTWSVLDQDFADVRRVIDTKVTSTVYLVQLVGRAMRPRGQGRILLTASIAGSMPGTYQAVYNGPGLQRKPSSRPPVRWRD